MGDDLSLSVKKGRYMKISQVACAGGEYVTLSKGRNDDILGIFEKAVGEKITLKTIGDKVKKGSEYFMIYEDTQGLKSVRVSAVAKVLFIQREEPKPFFNRAHMRYPIELDLEVSADGLHFFPSKSVNVSVEGLAFRVPKGWGKRGDDVYMRIPGHGMVQATIRWVSDMDGIAGASMQTLSKDDLLKIL
jgi:hypothetical protein